MPTIRFVDYPHISLTTPPLQILRPKIKKAYFAEAKIEEVEVTSTTQKERKTYTVQAGDNLSKIAAQEGVTVADIINSDDKLTEANKHKLKIGQKITLPTEVSSTEKKQKITFTKTNTGIIGSELYVIVETEDFQDYKVSISVKQGKAEGIEAQDTAISLKDEQGQYQTGLITTVGGLCDTDFENKDDYVDMAIFKVVIDTNDEEKKKSWIAALEKAEDQKTPLYLLVDAHTLQGQEKMNINYFGDTEDGEIRGEKVANRWLDLEGEWFMVEKGNCYCNRDLTEEDVKNIIGKEKLFYHKKCPLSQEEKGYKKFTQQINATFKKYSINTCLKKAHFIAQTEAESDHYKTTIEYADGWDYDHSTHKDGHDKYSLYLSDKKKYKKYNTKEIKRSYSRYKECIKHGHDIKGYGPKYKGKGLIQLTWKDTYTKYFKHIGEENLISTPEKVAEELKYSFDSAGWYWTQGSVWGNMNTKADNDDLIAVSIGINGGLNGYEHRKKNLKSILEKMKVKESCVNLKEKKIGVYKFETSTIKDTKFGKKNENKIKKYDD